MSTLSFAVKYMRPLPFFLMLAWSVISFSQDKQLDSLREVLLNQAEDTSQVNILNEMAALSYRSAPNESINYSSDARSLAEKLNFRRGLAEAYKNIGLGHYMQGNYTEAYKSWELSLDIFRELGNDQLVSNLLGNLGSIYYTMGKNLEAIDYNIQALKIAEKLGDSTRIGTIMLNIGNVYSEQPATLDNARDYYLQSLEIGESIGYRDLLALGSINLGEVYFKQEKYDSALFFFEKSLLYVDSQIDKAASLGNIGRTYAEKGDYSSAIEYHQDALKMAKQENAQLETTRILLGIAATYRLQNKPYQALGYYDEARTMAEGIGLNSELSAAYEGLAFIYSEIGDYKDAFKYLSLQNEIDNAIYKIETEDKTNQLMFSYQLEKKEDAIQILEREAEIEQLTTRRQRAVIVFTGSLGLLLLLLAGGLYSRFRFIRRTNRMINEQKSEIESQRDEIEAQRDQIQGQHDTVFSQKEMITDSISYAQRIQSAILPSQTLLNGFIDEYFILFKPKDIVSGDFYWIKEVQNHLVIVGADCTGHGVPGAFMSMLGVSLLNGLIGDRCYNEPSAILEQLRQKIKKTLVQEGNVEEQKDGMDMALAIIDKENRKLQFSGANNPIYIVRKKETVADKQLEPYFSLENDDYQLFELKGDKQPIGIHWEETAFTTHTVQLKKEDTFYIFSDGYVDQFGGADRKKFKSLNFKKLLLSIQHESMSMQERIVDETYETFKGVHEQIDDVCVIGVRL